jgi:hypothetical protein
MKRMVLTYWLSPEEENEFVDFVASTGDIIAYSVEWKSDPKDVAPQNLQSAIGSANPAQIMIGHRTGTNRSKDTCSKID